MDHPDRATPAPPPAPADRSLIAPGDDWRQLNICFGDWTTAETTAATHLAPVLRQAHTDGLITAWFFVRKSPCWRLRYQSNGDPAKSANHLDHALDLLEEQGRITGTTTGIYEPETHAFGGPDGMAVAHCLFHADSRHLLAHVAHSDRPRHRSELAILLSVALLRGAGLDWYEQGDVWARVAEHRAAEPARASPADRSDALEPSLRRLLTVDTSLLIADGAPLNHIANWSAAFTDTGNRITALATAGRLHRGVRAVLAHHIIFTWNRHGLSFAAQAALAHTAKHTIFGPDPAAENVRGAK